MASAMKTSEKALQKRSGSILAKATKRYKKFMQMAGKAIKDHKREEYIGAALGALVLTGLAASQLQEKFATRRPVAAKKAAKKAPKKTATKKAKKS